MRIIAGTHKGRKLATPKGLTTRPTPDRVRESLFSILAARISQATVLDAFAGSGAFGLESLSRGARFVTLIERHKSARKPLYTNCQMFNEELYEIVELDTLNALPQLHHRYDIVFVDPPYAENLWSSVLEILPPVLKPSALVLCEHPARNNLALPADFKMIDKRKFGDIAVTFLQMERA